MQKQFHTNILTYCDYCNLLSLLRLILEYMGHYYYNYSYYYYYYYYFLSCHIWVVFTTI